ncbi:MAG: hypothetical protein R2764_14275 [Bacteroidales bacterium]
MMETYMSSEQVLDELDLLSEKITENLITNYYWNSFNSNELIVFKGINTLVILDKEIDFYRTYYFSDNYGSVEKILNSIEEKTLVLEYLAKEKSAEAIEMFNKAGFNEFSVHHKIVNKTLPKFKINQELHYATSADVPEIYESLFNNFVRYSDHLPTIEFLENAALNKNIILYKENDKIIAYIIFEIKGGTSYFGFWFSSQKENPLIGINLMVNLYGLLNSKNIKMAYGWVKDDNYKVIDIHKKFGFYFEGLTNYIYLKNPQGQ